MEKHDRISALFESCKKVQPNEDKYIVHSSCDESENTEIFTSLMLIEKSNDGSEAKDGPASLAIPSRSFWITR